MFGFRILGLFGVLSWAGVEMLSEANSRKRPPPGRLGLRGGRG